MAAHTIGTAHPAKRADEEHMRDDEDGGRRQRARRESDTKNMTEQGTLQPSARTSVEPSGTASISYRSRETIKISAEAKLRITPKGNFHDIGIEKIDKIILDDPSPFGGRIPPPLLREGSHPPLLPISGTSVDG